MKRRHLHHPFLVGKAIYLRGLEAADLDGPYFQWLNDQDSDVYTSHALWPNARRRMRAFLERVSTSRNELVLAIVEKAGNRHVGNIGLHQINWVHRSAVLAILIGEAGARGRGYGTEAVTLLVEHAFWRLNLHRVELGVRADNRPAIRSYRKAGFADEGVFREAFCTGGGRYLDVLRMARLNPRG